MLSPHSVRGARGENWQHLPILRHAVPFLGDRYGKLGICAAYVVQLPVSGAQMA
jgi:hypothetical protein